MGFDAVFDLDCMHRQLQELYSLDSFKELLQLYLVSLDFHKKYYSSNIGFACLYNNQPIEAMKKVAIDLLAGIPNNNATSPNYTDALRPFTASQCKKLTKIKKIDEGQELSIYYPLPFYSPD